MKVIFLDFDGVINNWHSFDEIDPKNVECLLKIINSTNAKIVVTSSKKYIFQLDKNINYEDTGCYKYIKILEMYGIETYGITPYVKGKRELEIIEYLNEDPEIEEFLILDDDSVIESLKDHQVFLDLYKGITEEHIIPSINILNGNLGFYPPDFNFFETPMERLIRINKYYNNK